MSLPDAWTLDVIAEVGITVFGLAAIILVSVKSRWGFVCGLASQPFWFVMLYTDEKWLVLGLSCVYTVSWIVGIYVWFFRTGEDTHRATHDTPESCCCQCHVGGSS